MSSDYLDDFKMEPVVSHGEKQDGQAASDFWSVRFALDEQYKADQPIKSFSDRAIDYFGVLRSVRRAANVVSNSGSSSLDENTIEVRWAMNGDKNTCSSNYVYLSPDIVAPSKTLRREWKLAELTDVLIGQALAESAMKRTVDLKVESRYLRGAAFIPQMVVERRLWMIFERIGAEKYVVDSYPGFHPYFAAQRAYFTSQQAFDGVQTKIMEQESALSFFRALEWELLHPEQHLELPPTSSGVMQYAFKEISRMKANSNSRAEKAARIAQKILEAWPVPPSESESFNEAMGEGKTKKSEQIGMEVRSEVSVSRGVQQAVVMCLAAEETETETVDALPPDVVNWKGDSIDIMVKPDVYYDKYVRSLKTTIEAFKARLKFRNERNSMIEHGLRKGRIDDGSLYKLGFYKFGFTDPNVFEEEAIISLPDIAICLLVDESGSMGHGHERYTHSRKLAVVLANALASIKGVKLAVLGHTAQGFAQGHTLAQGLALHHYYTPKNPCMQSLSKIYAFSQNLDGFAIAKTARYMLEWYPGVSKKMLIVISDGQPHGEGYSGPSALEHVGRVVRATRRSGISVIGIGVDDAFSEEVGKQMYDKDFLVLSAVEKAYGVVTNIIKKVALSE